MAEAEGKAAGGAPGEVGGTQEWETLHEGKAKVLHRPGEAFYNPAQVQNRDLSVAVLREFGKLFKKEEEERKAKDKNPKADGAKVDGATSTPAAMTILEGLSATGLRAVRYAKEIEWVDKIVANDCSSQAVESIRRNIEHNRVGDRVEASQDDAAMLMYKHKGRGQQFTVVDLDPYGTAAPFLDSGVQAVADGGLMCVTCTDMAVLCGTHSEACHAKYGAISLRGKHCHEFALRLVLSCIEKHANIYKRHITPLLCVHMDFYVRLFFRVNTSAQQVKYSASKNSMVYQCTSCGAHAFQPIGKKVEKGNSVKFLPGNGPPVGDACEHCGGRHQLGGPIWTAPMNDKAFVQSVMEQIKSNPGDFASEKRLYGLLSSVHDEMEDRPLFQDLSVMASHLNVTTPSKIAIESALVNAGYTYSYSHTDAMGMKTDAPPSVLWDIMRSWATLHPPTKVKDNSPAQKLLATAAKFTADFTIRADLKKAQKETSAPKFLPAPTPDWGPMQRARGAGKGVAGGEEPKREKGKRDANQGKKGGRKRQREAQAAEGGEVEGEEVWADEEGSGVEEGAEEGGGNKQAKILANARE